jgi:dTDP-4-amino-4,6-dideoxygalactose transaminase
MSTAPKALRFPLIRPVLPSPVAWLPYLQPAYDRHYFTNFGPSERLLSQRIAGRFCAPGGEAVLASNATIALTATLMALGVRGRVAIPAFTFPATLHAVLAAGCRPVLLDVDPLTWELTSTIVRQALADGPLAAIMPVRSFGFMRDHSEMIMLARAAGIPIVFDSAAGLGHVRLPIGGSDDAGYSEVFSLHATKSFAIGEGGAILCAPVLAAQLRRTLNFGLNEDRSFGDGINGKMAEVQAAVGNAALDMLDGLLARRLQVVDAYVEMFRPYNSLTLPVRTAGCPWSVFPVLLPEECDTMAVVEKAASRGLQVRRYYFPSLLQGYRGRGDVDVGAGPFETAEALSNRMVCFPVYADMTDGEIDEIRDVVEFVFS